MLPIYIALLYYWLLSRLIPGLYRQWKIRKHIKAKRRLIIFSRYPVSGKTKTRLIPCLGAFGAATLQLLMTDHMLSVASKCFTKIHDFCVELRYFGGDNTVVEYWLNRRDPLIVHRPQLAQGDLGDKMADAIKAAFDEGAKSVVLIGSDIPGIDMSIIRIAFKDLDKDLCDVVIGQAQDGGYYLIGLSRNAQHKLDKLFKGIEWGSDNVFKQQLEVCRKLGVSQIILPPILEDVDYEDDISEVDKHIGINKMDILRPKWSIVIPILNDSQNLIECVRKIVQNADSPDRIEIVVADGQSKDNPLEVVSRLQEELKSKGTRLKIVFSEKGRGRQLITGSEAASHKLLMYIHADSRVPNHFDTLAWHTIAKPGVVAGAFRFGVDAVHVEKKRKTVSWWFLQKMKLLEWGTKRRASKYELPYGDQGLFMWRQTYDRIGGYKKYRLFEDYELVCRLKKHGHIALVSGPPLITSSRRWEKHGYLKITGLNTLLIIAYKCGIDPETLARWYYGDNKQ